MTEHNTLSVLADATRLPDHIKVSIEGLAPGSRVTAGSVVLPEGVELAADPDMVIAVVAAAPTAEEMEAEAAPAEAPAAEPAETPAPAEA